MSFAERYGPWAVIAGASEGTGREYALQVAREGVTPFLIARRAAPLAELAAAIRAETGIECATATVDLGKADAFDRIRDAVGDREVGLYVSNAGADSNGSKFLDADMSVWLAHIQMNVTTVAQCCHHFGGPMRARGRGGLLLVNSGACYGGSSYLAAYTATKAFTLCLAESLWAELKPHGVDVLTLVMAMTDTPMLRELMESLGKPIPDTIAPAADVAAAGLARLAHGPVHNIGMADDQAMYASLSAAARRDRAAAMSAGSARMYEPG